MNVISSIAENYPETLLLQLYIKVLKDEALNANQVEELFSNPELTPLNVFSHYLFSGHAKGRIRLFGSD